MLLTKPVVNPTDATDAALLLQVPPVEPSVKAEVEPRQRLVKPDIPAGIGFTVITSALAQPVLVTL
jgi:hypothetical protein